MDHFWPYFTLWLSRLPDTRDQRLITYDRQFLAWWGLLLFALKLRSRRQLDFDLRDPESCVLHNVNRLARTHQETLPVSGTLEHFLGHVGAAPFAGLRTSMVSTLIRTKALDDARLEGCVVVAFDGTGWLFQEHRHCPLCMTQTRGDKTFYYHMVEEAKVIGPSGLALSVGTEFMENADFPGDNHAPKSEQTKQDYELQASERLADAIKHQFPQLRICVTADSEFACGRGVAMARDHGWSFVFTFKEGRTPALWQDFLSLLDLCPENRLTHPLPGGGQQVYRWVHGLQHEDSVGRTHTVNALICLETIGSETTRFAWITDFNIDSTNVVEVATKGGRARWRIENEGFNMQKNSDFNLEHPYTTDPEILKAYYYLLQIAHLILQILEKGSLLRHLAAKAGKTATLLFGSLKNIARRLLEVFRFRLLPESAFDHVTAAAIQIRLRTG